MSRTAPLGSDLAPLYLQRGRGAGDREHVNATGEIFISGTVLNGRFTLRLATGNRATKREHVERAWALIREGAGS
jgi:hypothetical protein